MLVFSDNMNQRVRASPKQLEVLLEFMETHGDLGKTPAGLEGRKRSEELWSKLTNILNNVGVNRTTDKWKKVWADWKTKTKKKGLTTRQPLSTQNKRLLAVMGAIVVEGQTSNSQSPGRDDPATVEDTAYSEIVVETSYLPSSLRDTTSPLILFRCRSSQGPQPAMPFPASPPALTAPTPPTLAAPTPPTLATPTPPAPDSSDPEAPDSLNPEAPDPSAPVARTTRRRRRSTATPPSAKRRSRLRSPATPESARFPDRPRLRARRHWQAPTPLERAVSDFTTVELRRLEIEETRLRYQHERDLRTLEVEHERNKVFKSLLNVAQACLGYFNSRNSPAPVKIE